MELLKRSFQDLQPGDECLFRTDRKIVVHAVKVAAGRILDRTAGEEASTGQFHDVWQIVEKRDKAEEGVCPRCGRPY